MANKKISEFEETLGLLDNAFIPVVQGNPIDDYKISKQTLIDEIVKEIPRGNYELSTNKPTINDIELSGNKTSEDLGLQPAGDYIELITSIDNHIVINNDIPNNPTLSFLLVDNENLLTDDELAVVQNTSGVNTGDQDLSGLQTKEDNLLETESTNIVGAINEVNAIAKQASNGRVFATVIDLDAWLAVPENVAILKVGDAFYIIELDVPDYWWDGTQKQKLETQKVDLSQYYTSAQIDTLLGNYYASSEIDTILSGYYTSSQIDTLLSGKQDAITPTVDTTPQETDEVITKRGTTWLRTTYADWKTALALTFAKISDYFSKVESNSRFALQDGLISWYNGTTMRWFTPTGTFSSVGTAVITTGNKLTAAMVGAKIGVGTDRRIITAYLTTNTCTVDSAFNQDYSGVISADWGVYSKQLQSSTGMLLFYTTTGNNRSQINAVSGLQGNIRSDSLAMIKYTRFFFSNSISNWEIQSVGLQYGDENTLEVCDGMTRGSYKKINTNGGKFGTIYSTALTTATNNTAKTSIAVDQTTNFPATGTIIIGGVTSVNYTSKTATSLVFASTVIPTYAVGTNVLVTSAGSYTEIKSNGQLSTPALEYADNAAAIAGGLKVNDIYRTGDLLKVVH